MSITAKDLAKKLNLSEAAISMALNNKPGVSTPTRLKIIEAAKKYGYDFSRLEESKLSNKINGTIQLIIYKKCGAIVSDTPFFSQLIEGITSECKTSHYHLNISYIYDNDNIADILAQFNVYNCCGIILLGTEMLSSDLTKFLNLKVSLVIIDTYFNTISSNFVLINNNQGAFMATDYLIKRCKSQPGYLRSSYSIPNFDERAKGFFDTIRMNGMSASKSIIHHLTPSIEGAYADMCLLLSNNEDIAKCYFADNDLIAYGAIKALKEYGYNVPEDVSIIGFDDIRMANYMDPPLTTIRVPIQSMGSICVHRLIDLLTNKSSVNMKIELSTELIIRNSVI